MSTVVKDLGAVTAYADAVAAGYTGTKEEWQTLMASYASVAEEAQEAREGAEAAQDAAEDARDAAISAKTGAESAVSGFGTVVTQATNQAVQTVRAEGTTQVGNVSSEGTTQVNAVQAKGAEVLQSIPSDYTELSNDVVQLKEDFNEITETVWVGEPFENGVIRTNVNVGATVDTTVITNNAYMHAMISCKKGDQFKVSGTGGDGWRLWAFTDSSYTLISKSTGYLTVTDLIVTAPADGYLIVNAGWETKALYSAEIEAKIPERYSNLLDLFYTSYNLFDKTTIQRYKTIDASNGQIIDSATNCVSTKITVKPNTSYTATGVYTRITIYAADDTFISTHNSEGNSYITVVMPNNASYIRVSMNVAFSNTCMLYEGVYDGREYMAYSEPYLPSEYLGKNELPYEWAAEDVTGTYEPYTTASLAGGSGALFNYTTVMVSDIYAMWDALVTAHPDYVTKKNLGKDQTGTYDIYEYDFTPSRAPMESGTDDHKPLPCILITGGMHGDGTAGDKAAMIGALIQTFTDICNNWDQNSILEYMRWSMRWKVVPISNPWGQDNRSRKNGRGVDINRNFGISWTGSLAPDNPAYGGTAPFSEAETRILRDFIQNNKDDAVCHTELHTTAGIQEVAHLIYYDMHSTSVMAYPAYALVNKVTHLWQKGSYGGLDTSVEQMGYITDHDGEANISNWTEKVEFLPSAIIEGFPNYTNSTETLMGAKIDYMVCEELGNWLWTLIKFFKNKQQCN